eukprot:TRINITY_DN2548_c0_g1_i2.p1 TRINITY_DN2548_c0_g1~~TRINITY_DN2548_c0_g1_i2.p1  ORF type:complete len:189 (+),score=43.66 TRINITY_DN2548_c0_g1_i2:70-636(+)
MGVHVSHMKISSLIPFLNLVSNVLSRKSRVFVEGLRKGTVILGKTSNICFGTGKMRMGLEMIRLSFQSDSFFPISIHLLYENGEFYSSLLIPKKKLIWILRLQGLIGIVYQHGPSVAYERIDPIHFECYHRSSRIDFISESESCGVPMLEVKRSQEDETSPKRKADFDTVVSISLSIEEALEKFPFIQ